MSNDDKRTVSTDALETLGMIIGENEKRDAIHLAVEPMLAKVKVFPGQDVNHEGSPMEPFVGIVDPFLKSPVLPGERFWLVIYPRQIHSLRHVWTHPAFTDETKEENQVDPVLNSIEWIKRYCDSLVNENGYRAEEITYEEIMEAADECIEAKRKEAKGKGDGYYDHICGGGELLGVTTSSEFWDHYEIVKGVQLTEKEKSYNFFSCAC